MLSRKKSSEVYIISLEYIENPIYNDGNFNVVNNPPAKSESKSLWKHRRTLMYCLSTCLGFVVIGTGIAFPSPAFPNLNSIAAPFHLSQVELSLATSIFSLGGMFGLILGGYLISKFGRQFIIVNMALPTTLGWLLITAAENAGFLYAGRLLTGLSSGVLQVAVPVYISEISPPSVRGSMESCCTIARNLGYIFVYALGIFLPWNWLATACTALPVIMLLQTIRMPESPRWLLSNGYKAGAKAAMLRLRADGKEVAQELEEIEESLTAFGTSMELKDFKEATIYKPFLIVFGLMILLQVTGFAIFHVFLGTILKSTGSSLDPNVQATIVGVFGGLVTVGSGFAIDKAGRRFMLILSAFVMMLSLATLASSFTLEYYDVTISSDVMAWLIMFSIVFYECGASLGYGVIPYFLSSELFPLKARGIVGGLSMCSLWLFATLSTFFFPILLQTMHAFAVYWMMAGFAALAMLYAYVFVPETKGKSLEELEKHFKK